jgi:hypothetical protein
MDTKRFAATALNTRSAGPPTAEYPYSCRTSDYRTTFPDPNGYALAKPVGSATKVLLEMLDIMQFGMDGGFGSILEPQLLNHELT